MKLRFPAAALLLLLAVACAKDDIGHTDAPLPPDGVPYYSYGLARIEVTTDGGVAVDSKRPEDYRPCTVKVDGGGVFESFSARGAIRGRGNSTWNWYPKKPYRLKLDEGHALLDMRGNRDWVLLADYRDVTHMMNNVGFTLAHELGLPCANHSRYATVTLNGEDLGLYMVTEQVEEGGHRVPLDPEEGILLALDINDGPGDVPRATDNFWSEEFWMACAVKYPRDATRKQRTAVKEAFAELEQAIAGSRWKAVEELLDVQSMIDYILIQEIIGNVEVDNYPSMRSGFIHRYCEDSLWVMGPLWDCDGGFNYNWGDMYDHHGRGHTYFEGYRNLIFGTDPYYHIGAYGSTPGDFFCSLWGFPEFVSAIKSRWASTREDLLEAVIESIENTEEVIADAAARDLALWGIENYNHTEEVGKLIEWLTKRFAYLNTVIPNYPTH